MLGCRGSILSLHPTEAGPALDGDWRESVVSLLLSPFAWVLLLNAKCIGKTITASPHTLAIWGGASDSRQAPVEVLGSAEMAVDFRHGSWLRLVLLLPAPADLGSHIPAGAER
jgi:hypothetical protein